MAEFTLDEDQKQILDMTRRFAENELRPRARECDEAADLPEDLLDKVWELGFCPNVIPEQYGGYDMGRSAVTAAVMAEELAWGDLGLTLGALSPPADDDPHSGVRDRGAEGGVAAPVLRRKVLSGHGRAHGAPHHLRPVQPAHHLCRRRRDPGRQRDQMHGPPGRPGGPPPGLRRLGQGRRTLLGRSDHRGQGGAPGWKSANGSRTWGSIPCPSTG